MAAMKYECMYGPVERELGMGGGERESTMSSLGGGREEQKTTNMSTLWFWRRLNIGLKCFLLCGTDLWSLKEKQSVMGKGAVGPACHFRMMDEANSRFVISGKKLAGARMYPSYSRGPPQKLDLDVKFTPFQTTHSVYVHSVWECGWEHLHTFVPLLSLYVCAHK